GDMIRSVLESWRERITSEGWDWEQTQAALAGERLALEVRALLDVEARRGVRHAINVSGVVLNTGLGRAPVHHAVAQRMAQVAGGFCVLEVDRETGRRNQRDARLGELLSRLTGAEAGIAVNNNAAAVLLLMHAFAKGREAIVSRGELVEIGGSFRIPEVLESAGARLVAVGATNRTRLADYRQAIVQTTGLLLKVHTSNYRVIGFTEEVDPKELASLGREHSIPSAWDLGSGRIEARGANSLDRIGGETEVREAVASGVDVVTFSGDKLLGAPQAGLLVGTREAIARLRNCPMYRALRLDKVGLAGLEATLELLLEGRGDELPARRMLLMGGAETKRLCDEAKVELSDLPGITVRVVASHSEPGSGSAPTVTLPGYCLQVDIPGLSPQRAATALRLATPPVFARVQEDSLWLDLRTLLPGELADLRRALAQVLDAHLGT
ncbi:MAG TPA: L-seryl-tRNA(Sec) selenium transferase, partial [Planctomycetota bacterium]|nr:L-seryl-tRNA(Sec) selenium transferase [Planctomycetota bacterium]